MNLTGESILVGGRTLYKIDEYPNRTLHVNSVDMTWQTGVAVSPDTVWRIGGRDGDTEVEQAKGVETMMMHEDYRDIVRVTFEKAVALGAVRADALMSDRDMLTARQLAKLYKLAEENFVCIFDRIAMEKDAHDDRAGEGPFVPSPFLSSLWRSMQKTLRLHWDVERANMFNAAIHRIAVVDETERGNPMISSAGRRSRQELEERARRRVCAHDGCRTLEPVDTLRCSKCKAVRYCNPDCQKAHHVVHKGFCNINAIVAQMPGGHSVYYMYRKLRRHYKKQLRSL
jgi:hypothetical protein